MFSLTARPDFLKLPWQRYNYNTGCHGYVPKLWADSHDYLNDTVHCHHICTHSLITKIPNRPSSPVIQAAVSYSHGMSTVTARTFAVCL